MNIKGMCRKVWHGIDQTDGNGRPLILRGERISGKYCCRETARKLDLVKVICCDGSAVKCNLIDAGISSFRIKNCRIVEVEAL